LESWPRGNASPEPQPRRKDLKPVVYVMGDWPGKGEPVYAILALNEKLDALKLRDGEARAVLVEAPETSDRSA